MSVAQHVLAFNCYPSLIGHVYPSMPVILSRLYLFEYCKNHYLSSSYKILLMKLLKFVALLAQNWENRKNWRAMGNQARLRAWTQSQV